MGNGFFSVVLHSKIQDRESFEIYTDNLISFFNHLAQPELVRYVYFVDDSDKEFQNSLRDTLFNLIEKTCPKVELVEITDNGNIYNAVNRTWKAIDTEYVISFNSDHRLIQTLPLAAIKKAFEKYPYIYSMILTTRSFGYTHPLVKKEIKKLRPYYGDFKDDEMTTWFYFDEVERKIYSLPYKLYLKQKAGVLPIEALGNELRPLIIDEENNFWITKLPPRFLKGYYTNHEAFTGNPAILRTAIVKKYLPLPKRYEKEGPAECQEMYFRRTDIDCKYHIGYLNLQAFAIQYKDPTKPFWNVEKEYWQSFLEKNSKPFTYKDFGISREEAIKNSQQILKKPEFSLRRKICCIKASLIPKLEEFTIFLFGKSRAKKIAKYFWRLFGGNF